MSAYMLDTWVKENMHKRWMWGIQNKYIIINSMDSYKTEDEASEAAHKFINKCLTDRSTWPEEFR